VLYPESFMSEGLRVLRRVFMCCAAVAIVVPATAQQPAQPATPKPPAQQPAQPAAPKPPAQRPAQAPAAQPPAGQTPAAQTPAQALKDPVVATVNGVQVRLSELEVAQQALPQQYRS